MVRWRRGAWDKRDEWRGGMKVSKSGEKHGDGTEIEDKWKSERKEDGGKQRNRGSAGGVVKWRSGWEGGKMKGWNERFEEWRKDLRWGGEIENRWSEKKENLEKQQNRIWVKDGLGGEETVWREKDVWGWDKGCYYGMKKGRKEGRMEERNGKVERWRRVGRRIKGVMLEWRSEE